MGVEVLGVSAPPGGGHQRLTKLHQNDPQPTPACAWEAHELLPQDVCRICGRGKTAIPWVPPPLSISLDGLSSLLKMPQSSGHLDMEAFFLRFHSPNPLTPGIRVSRSLTDSWRGRKICFVITGALLKSFSLDVSLLFPPWSTLFSFVPLESCLLSEQNSPAPGIPFPPLERLINSLKQGGCASEENLVPVLKTMNFQPLGQTCPHTRPSARHLLPSKDPELNGVQMQTSQSPG